MALFFLTFATSEPRPKLEYEKGKSRRFHRYDGAGVYAAYDFFFPNTLYKIIHVPGHPPSPQLPHGTNGWDRREINFRVSLFHSDATDAELVMFKLMNADRIERMVLLRSSDEPTFKMLLHATFRINFRRSESTAATRALLKLWQPKH